MHPDLDSAGYAVLVAVRDLAAAGGGARGGDISDVLGLHKSTTSRNLTTLEDLGLIERIPDPADARARQVRLTTAGCRGAGALGVGSARAAARAAGRLGGAGRLRPRPALRLLNDTAPSRWPPPGSLPEVALTQLTGVMVVFCNQRIAMTSLHALRRPPATDRARTDRPPAREVVSALSSLIRASRSIARQRQAQLGASGTPLAILKVARHPARGRTAPATSPQATGVAPVGRQPRAHPPRGGRPRRPPPRRGDARACHITLTAEGRSQLATISEPVRRAARRRPRRPARRRRRAAARPAPHARAGAAPSRRAGRAAAAYLARPQPRRGPRAPTSTHHSTTRPPPTKAFDVNDLRTPARSHRPSPRRAPRRSTRRCRTGRSSRR